MAGTSPGVATAPPSSSTPKRDPRASRTRLGHCAIGVGAGTLQVFSSRERGAARGISVALSGDVLQLTGSMTPPQARSLARALTSAADAVERQGGAR